MADVFLGNYLVYFSALGCVRLIQVALLFRLYALDPQHAPKTYNIATGIAIASGLWIVSSFLPPPYHFVVALAALALDMLTPLTKGKGNTVRLLNVHHLQERLGLFLMLVLGESMLVVALVSTSASTLTSLPQAVFLGLLITIVVWWLYFDYLERCVHGERPRHLFWYLQGHCLVFLSLIFVAAGYKNIIADGTYTVFDTALIAGGLFGVIAGLLAVRITLSPLPRVMVVAFIGALFLIGIITISNIFTPYAVFNLTGGTVIALGLIDRLFLRKH